MLHRNEKEIRKQSLGKYELKMNAIGNSPRSSGSAFPKVFLDSFDAPAATENNTDEHQDKKHKE